MSDQEENNPPSAAEDINGILIRSADGKLYFIPHDKLGPFLVPEKGEGLMSDKLGASDSITDTSIPAHWTHGAEPLCAVGSMGAEEDKA